MMTHETHSGCSSNCRHYGYEQYDSRTLNLTGNKTIVLNKPLDGLTSLGPISRNRRRYIEDAFFYYSQRRNPTIGCYGITCQEVDNLRGMEKLTFQQVDQIQEYTDLTRYLLDQKSSSMLFADPYKNFVYIYSFAGFLVDNNSFDDQDIVSESVIERHKMIMFFLAIHFIPQPSYKLTDYCSEEVVQAFTNTYKQISLRLAFEDGLSAFKNTLGKEGISQMIMLYINVIDLFLFEALILISTSFI